MHVQSDYSLLYPLDIKPDVANCVEIPPYHNDIKLKIGRDVMTTQPTNTLEIPSVVEPDGANTPNVSNPGEPTVAPPANDVDALVGNNNGNNQSETIEPIKTPTAHDTIAAKRLALEQQLAELEQQETIADITDIVIDMLNASKNDKLKTAKSAMASNINLSIMWDNDKSEFRYAETYRRATVVNQPHVPGSSNGTAKRTWFVSVTGPDGVTYAAPMKSDVSNDIPKLSGIVGIDLGHDGNGNSTSTLAKCNMLKSKNWTFETASNF